MLLTATQSFCILHIIKHAVHTFVFGKECKDEVCLCILKVSLVILLLEGWYCKRINHKLIGNIISSPCSSTFALPICTLNDSSLLQSVFRGKRVGFKVGSWIF